jgi:hypothetical protein
MHRRRGERARSCCRRCARANRGRSAARSC